MPSSASDLAWLTARPIAHRGLHDLSRSIPENSLGAFRAAMKAGYAIECDIRRSRDGVPMVFHDRDLARMTGIDGRIDELTVAELSGLRLHGTGERIPTLADLLEIVDCRVPIVVEAKGVDESSDRGFLKSVGEYLGTYGGPLALMSFDDWLLAQSEELGVDVPIGLTAEGTRLEVLERHRVVFEGRCSFVSYNVHHLPNAFVGWVRTELGAPVISWTVRTPADVERSAAHADQMTFEGFDPDAF